MTSPDILMPDTLMPDILMVADPRFAGGTSSALVADTEAFLALGAQVGLMFVHSGYLNDAVDRPNPAVLALLDRPGVTAITPTGTIRAGTAFLHHPMVFFHGIREQVSLDVDRAVLVTHHAPFRGDGSLEYDPLMTTHRIGKALGINPLWAPISGLCRHQLKSFAPLIRLTGEDWINIFDTADWVPEREIFSTPRLTIGRHGRVDPLKWPETAEGIAHSLPPNLPPAPEADASYTSHRIRVMGCPVDDLQALGADMSAWEILPFGAEPVARFLDSLDVFSYFHHPLWVETFGRTVAEAALMGRVCLLDPLFRPTFGDMALYCPRAEVGARLAELQANPDAARAQGARARNVALEQLSIASVEGRWHRLQNDPGTSSRAGGVAHPPLHTARKLLGLHRRRARGSIS